LPYFAWRASKPEDLLTVADISLYRAKSEGKDKTVVLLSSQDRDEYLERFRSERELVELIRRTTSLATNSSSGSSGMIRKYQWGIS